MVGESIVLIIECFQKTEILSIVVDDNFSSGGDFGLLSCGFHPVAEAHSAYHIGQ